MGLAAQKQSPSTEPPATQIKLTEKEIESEGTEEKGQRKFKVINY